jgi:hypothetical protein
LNRLKNEKLSSQAKNPTPILEGEPASNAVAGSSNKKSSLVTAAKRIYRKCFDVVSPMIIESFTPNP